MSGRGRASGPGVACRHCGARAVPAFATGDRNRRLSGETFRYHRCPGCGLVFLDPVPESLAAYYPSEYYGSISAEQLGRAAAAVEGYKLELVRRFVPAGRLLDVGPAMGGFAHLAKQAGFEVEAIEMDAACCSFLSGELGIRSFESADVAGVLRREGPWDVVTFWHVVEHLADPWDALAAAAHALRPAGVLVVAAPSPGSLQLRLLRGRWSHVDAPRHLQLAPALLVAKHLAEAGLELLLDTRTDPGGLGWNRFGWRESLAGLSTREAPRRALRRLGTAVEMVARPLERSGLRGAAYTLVFGRPA